jgi:hypothetical protein
MAVRPDDRYQSVQEMRKDLAMARNLSIGTKTQNRLVLVWSSLLPHKWLTLGVLFLFLAALLMTIVQPQPLF